MIKHDFIIYNYIFLQSVQAWLKDGTRLCALMNVIQPGSIGKVNNSKMAFKQMENISKFTDAIEKYGMKKQDKFQVN